MMNGDKDGPFAEVGMQLLTADEFLDTPEKQQAYASFKLEMGGMSSEDWLIR
jgi:hypothetical protein